MSSVLVLKEGIQAIVLFPVESHLRCGSISFAKAFLHGHQLTRVYSAFSRTENHSQPPNGWLSQKPRRASGLRPLCIWRHVLRPRRLILQPEFKRNLVCGQARSGQTAFGRPPKGIEPLPRASSSVTATLGIPAAQDLSCSLFRQSENPPLGDLFALHWYNIQLGDSIRVPFHLAQYPDPVIPGGAAPTMRPRNICKSTVHAHSFPGGALLAEVITTRRTGGLTKPDQG